MSCHQYGGDLLDPLHGSTHHRLHRTWAGSRLHPDAGMGVGLPPVLLPRAEGEG
ncbi:MAG: hypothetical protein WBG19_06000 [Thermoplasmata archaeon]